MLNFRSLILLHLLYIIILEFPTYTNTETENELYFWQSSEGPGTVPLPDNYTITQIALGNNGQRFAISNTGVLLSWGKGSSGALGHGDCSDVDDPKVVQCLSGLKVIAVAAANEHAVVLLGMAVGIGLGIE